MGRSKSTQHNVDFITQRDPPKLTTKPYAYVLAGLLKAGTEALKSHKSHTFLKNLASNPFEITWLHFSGALKQSLDEKGKETSSHIDVIFLIATVGKHDELSKKAMELPFLW